MNGFSRPIMNWNVVDIDELGAFLAAQVKNSIFLGFIGMQKGHLYGRTNRGPLS